MFQEIWRFFKNDKKSLRSIFIFTLATGVLVLAIPFLIQNLLQQYLLLTFQQSTTFLLLLVGLFLAAIAFMRILQMHLSEYLQRRIFVSALQDAKKNYEAKKITGEAISRQKWNYIFEAIVLQKSAVPLFINGVTFLLQSLLILTLISIYHPFFIVYSLIIAISFYYVTIVMGRKALRLSMEESTLKHRTIAHLQENPEEDDLEKDTKEYLNKRQEKYTQYVRQSIGLFIIKICSAVLLLLAGGVLVLQNQMTIGQLIASELIITNLLISLFKFTNILDY